MEERISIRKRQKMKHQIKPCADQTVNPAIDRNDPQAAATAIELEFPETFSRKAWRVIRYLEGAICLYAYKGRFIVTDESLELTAYGDGSREAPYGAPRFICDSLDELEQTLEDLADCYDASGDIPGWETERPEPQQNGRHEPSPNVLVTLVRSSQFIGVKTYCRKLGRHGRFLICQDTLRRLAESPAGAARCESDCGDYVKIIRLENALQFSFAWLNTYSDGSVRGDRQDITIPLHQIRLALDYSEEQRYLYIPPAPNAAIDARPASRTLRNVVKEKLVRRAFSKAMRSCFRWPGERITLYPDGRYSFYFTTRSGYPGNGGLILHEGEKNGHACIYYAVHT